MTQDAQSVTQADRDAAASFYQDHLARPGEVPVAAAMRMRHIDESPLIQAFAAHRLASQPTDDAVALLKRWAEWSCGQKGLSPFHDTRAFLASRPTPQTAAIGAEALELGKIVLEGRGHGTYSEAEDAIRSLIAALTRPGGTVETGWLIEHTDQPEWLTLLPTEAAWQPCWTKDSLDALRFCRRRDAEDYVSAHFGGDGPVIITEHHWVVALQPEKTKP